MSSSYCVDFSHSVQLSALMLSLETENPNSRYMYKQSTLIDSQSRFDL